MASSVRQWYVGQDGCIPIGEPANGVTYHSSLNSLIVTTNEPAVKIYDVTSGSVLHKSNLCAEKGDLIHCVYLPERNKVVVYNSSSVGVRSDLHGVLLLDTALQTPVLKTEELIHLELPLAEACQFLKSIQSAELTCPGYIDIVVKELEKQIAFAQEATKGNHKTTKWATVCIHVPHVALKTVSSALVMEMRRVNVYSPGLSTASAVSDRLGYLLPSNIQEQGESTVERTLMYSEAARRETFKKWPHMNYKWALPDPMAQAGFYHQPNVSGDDRAMCFTCNVCLVCWEPTDEPWSEHERHSPSCPFVKGEHTQNVPLSVTYATQPAFKHTDNGEKIECVSYTACENYIATSTKHGHIIVWSLKRNMKKYCQFVLDPTEKGLVSKSGIRGISSLDEEKAPGKSKVNTEDTTIVKPGKDDKGVGDDVIDAISTGHVPLGGDNSAKEDSLQDIPLHDDQLENDGSEHCFARPNEKVLVTSMFMVEKKDLEPEHPSSKSIKGKKDSSKKTKRPIQPSLICGVSIRKSKYPLNCGEDEGGGGEGGEEETELEKMNRINEVVSADTSPVTPPEIISSSEMSESHDISVSSHPYLLVVAVKEDVKKVSKQPSTDSLKPSTSSSNIVNTISSISKQDWPSLDYMYDSDPDVQIVKVTPGPQMLSASSPTEGTKLDEIMEPSVSHNKLPVSSESSKSSVSSIKAGHILQCVELPQDLQCEDLIIKHIKTTVDQQHLIVVLSRNCRGQNTCYTVSTEPSLSTEMSDFSGGFTTISGSSSQTYSKLSSDSTEPEIENGNKNSSSVQQASEHEQKLTHGYILLYRFNYDSNNNYALLEEKPVAIRKVEPSEVGIEQILVLPQEVSEQVEEEEMVNCDEEIFVGSPSLVSVSGNRMKNPSGVLAVIHTSGGINIINLCDLSILANIDPPTGDRFVDVTYCSGIDRLCLCSETGNLYFYQLSEEGPDQSDSMFEGDITPTVEIPELTFSGDNCKGDELLDQSPKVSDLLAKQDLSFESLSQLHNLIQFVNLMPRFTATVPPCWTEIQQEQQQRRHPQHLQHQGEATQHTRTWKLQCDNSTWDEHLFEIVLPRLCCVGHVDVKFTLNPHCSSVPKIQFTLLKQNINALGKQLNPDPAATSTPVDSKINFNIEGSEKESTSDPMNVSDQSLLTVNNVLSPDFLERHNAEVLCGPVDISDCLDLSGNSGIVSLTSPQLLMSRPRSFLLHIKGFVSAQNDQQTDKSKDIKKKKTTSEGVDKRKTKTIKGLFYTSSVGKTKLDNLKGCDTLMEISITIRKTKKSNITKERFQRNSMIELLSFHERLLSTVSFEEGYLLTGVSADHVQNMCLDILIWVTNIQMNDPDKRLNNKCILTVIQEKLKKIVQACYIQGTRTTAHKCSRLLSLCVEYSKASTDQERAPAFSLHLLEALLDSLQFIPCAYSAGALKWFFTLLNRVKCMDVISVTSKCSDLLNVVSKHFHEHASPLGALLKARYGLNGNPFECDMFDMELPQAVKQFIPGNQPSSYFGSVSSTSSSNSGGTIPSSQATQADDVYDFYDLFSNSVEKSSKSLMESARNHILGMLEVEPLHFTCHSTSDGTKMERLDNTISMGGTTVLNPAGLNTPGLGNSSLTGTINFGEAMPSTSSPYSHFPMPPMLPYTLQHNIAAAKHQLQELSTKNYPSVKHKIMHIKQILQEVGKNLPMSTQKTPSGSSEQMPSTPKTTPQVMTPPLTPPNEAWQQMLSQGEKFDTQKSSTSQSRPAMTVQTPHSLLQPPAPQVLVIERIYSGARRFVILDFGKPILLTDVIIPLCGDLASLSIDVWVQGEEIDGQRLIVASDIGFRSLVMNNIMPPPVCRFLKITTIGRYGSGTTRSKIPIGAFYGHSYILPWEWNTKSDHHLSPSTSSVASQLDFPTQSQLLSHLGSFMSLLEDIQCRYSLARTRLESLLVQTESLQYSSFLTQFYLKKNKKNDEDNNIIQAYNDCLQFQLQQNLAARAIDRLQSAIGLRLPSVLHTDNSDVMLKQASTDKLRFLLEHLLETVISITNSSSSIPQLPAKLYSSLDNMSCQSLFKYLCLHGNPRIQILTGMVLVRVCGSEPWFGEFLGNMLQEYFHSETMQVFSQDRVFMLLTAMGQRSLQGPSAISIMESLLQMLARVLSPVLGAHGGGIIPHTGQLDLSLIGWILLFLCRNLDSTVLPNGNGEDEEGARKDQGTNLSNRWNFIQANSNVKSQMVKSKSARLYRRSLQKRLLIHKQKLMDLEHMKKSFVSSDPANHALLKQQEKLFKKELSQYTSKHLKDIIQIRKNGVETLKKITREEKGTDDKENLEYEPDTVLILPKQKCLPVVHGLMALLLGMDFTCNVDLFLITCKVLARICISTRPAITLMEAMNQDQLERLIMLTTNFEFNHGNISWGGPWAGHALTCLLQDLLEGERVYPGTQFDGITDDEMSGQMNETDDSLQSSVNLSTLDTSNDTNQQSDSDSSTQAKEDSSKLSFDKSMVQMLLDDEDDDDIPEKLHAYVTGEKENAPPVNPTTNVMYVQPMPSSNMNGSLTYITADIDEQQMPKPTQTGYKGIKAIFGSTGYHPKPPPVPTIDTKQGPANNSTEVSQGLSTALDARLECGLETRAELRLRMMLYSQSDTLQGAFTSQLPVSSLDGQNQRNLRVSPSYDDMSDSMSGMPQVTSYEMLSRAYDDLFGQLPLQRVNMDSLLQLWLTLNEENILDTSTQRHSFDPSRIPTIPLSVVSIKNLLATVASSPALPVRTWVMLFQCLALTSNLKVTGEEPGIERSMVVPMIGDPNFVMLITKFLSGASSGSPSSSSESQFQVGPSAVQVFHLFLQRLHICMCGEDNIHRLKEIMLKLVYSLTAERGAFHSCLGPLDAQCKFLEFILELTYDQVDIYNAISVTESISCLVHQHIVCQERVTCKSTSDNGINCRSCFGGLFSSLLRGNESSTRTSDATRDQLMCSLLKVVNGLLHVQFRSRHGRNITSMSDSFQELHGSSNASRSGSLTDSSKLSHALATSTPHSSRSRSDEEKVGQTDEQKTETANQERIDTESQGTVLADIILGRRTIMFNFIQALSYCNSSTMAMILGSSGMASNMQDSFTNGDPLSVGDGIYQILVTLSRKCNNNRLLMDSLFMYLSGGFISNNVVSLCRLSEPILWFILKVLDSSAMLKLFLEKGGVEVVCRNFVNCNSRIISTTSSLISTIMQNMNGKGQAERRKKYETESPDGLQNFAPLGTISSSSPTAPPGEVLIVAAPHHRRARSAPWSYHFYPDEAWVDLKIVLPFAILLKEVQIQPHSPALSTCPSFVSLEASQDGVTSFPLCSPMNTGSLVFIKLQLQRPEVVTMVTIRLHKARDSMTIGLSQILLMGYSAFGETGYKTNNLFLPTEDIVSRSSVGWIRLLHHCLTSQRDMESLVAEAAAPTPSLLNTCTALLVSPISAMYAPTIETVLLKLGLHSGEMGLALIDNLLRNNTLHADSGFNSQYLGKVSGIANDSTVEILYQLGTVQDRWTSERVKAMLQWLGDSARVALQRKAIFSDDGFRQMPHEISHMTLPGPAPSHVHCMAAIVWRNGEMSVDYNPSQLITKDLVSSLYEWSSVLEIDSHLKKAVDYVLCAICHICPDAFARIMEWMGIVISPDYGPSSSIPDDRKDNSQYNTMTDDSKEAINALGQQAESPENSSTIILQELKYMCIDEAHLSTLALTCKSELATKQLLESGFPAVLAQGLFEFCNRVVSTFADSWTQPEGITDSCKSMSGNVGESYRTSPNSAGICITADLVSAVLNFFSEVSSRASMKEWLGGADGNIFWPVLLTMLCNTPLHSPISVSALPQKYELISVEERAAIETATVNFFSNIIACHMPNQMLFSKVLFDVIKEQGLTGKVGLGVCPLSGFTRRLFLQVLLEDDKILVSFRAPQQYRTQITSVTNQIQHPHFGAGRRFKTMLVNMHMTIGELSNKVSDTPSLAAQLLDVQNDKKSDESKKDSNQIGLEIVENICAANTIEAGATGKGNTPVADSSKLSAPPRPPTRRGRHTTDPLTKQLNAPTLSLYHKLISNKCLPSDLTLSQLLQVLQNHGLPQGHCVIDFSLQLGVKDIKDLSDDALDIPDDVLLTSPSYPTALQVFASVGGLALLAEHLPLLYPEISRQITTTETTAETQTGTLGDASQDWVTIDSYPEELYELYDPMSPAPASNPTHNIGNPSIPPHSLIAFGLFLRLPGYAEVLLKERKKAQCLLRLVLGVTDDGEGGHILTSPISNSLPTLPFIVLKSLFDTTPLTTDDGVLLRRMCLEIGALHLILACLSVLSHHAPRSNISGFQQDAQNILSAIQTPVTVSSNPTPYVTEEKSQQYWAKGTGFGTGSTTSSWDAEQALIRQKSEEGHVTCLLQVLASYINPGGGMPDDYNSDDYEPKPEKTLLPEVVPEMLSHSCLVPALSSYLRNDSVLDMARHVPLYRSLLLLLRAISTCPSLVMLLLPLEKDGNLDSATAVGELLEKMRGCVDTYASRLKSNKTKSTGTKEEEEENEGLAMLIPDIQETARIVQKATQRVKKSDGTCESADSGDDAMKGSLRESFDEVYLSEMKKLQFSQYEMVNEEGTVIKFSIKHHYEQSVKTAGDIKNPNRIRRLAQEAVTLSTSLPLSVSSSVFVRCDEERLDIMKVLITGPEDTPYANGCFEFDVYFPQDYPNAPPHINLETTGNQSVRFNPNLYNDGKVCLSVLNTWHGRPEEKWSPQTSSFLQVLVSIQSLILVCEPYFNEPGYERSRGTPSGTASSREYDSNIRQATVKWAILEQLKSPSPSFKDVIHKHFWLKRHRILKQCEEWIGEMESYSTDKRTGRTIAHSTLALKKHYNQLREEFAKFKPPEGLEDFGSGDIDPKEKQYQTDTASTSAPQVFPPDNNANSLLSTEDDLKQVTTKTDC